MIGENLSRKLDRFRQRASKAKAVVAGGLRGFRVDVTADATILLSLVAHAHYWRGKHDDADSFEFLRASIPPNGVFFDVGANIGVYLSTLWALKDRAVTMIGFEPIPDTLEILAQTLALNDVTARIERIGVSRTEGELRLSAYSRGMNNFWVKHDTHEHPTLAIPTRSLDACIADGFPEPDALKIDVEGHELEVLEGAVQLLSRKRPALLIECHGAAWDGLEVSRARFGELLRDAGYRNLRFSRGEPADFENLRTTTHLFAS